jgi:hypothetical protein
MGSLYNKVPDQIKLRDNLNLFKNDLKSFLLNHSFYSVEEFMSFETFNTVKPVLNRISRDQKIFPLKPGFRLIKVYSNNIISQGT